MARYLFRLIRDDEEYKNGLFAKNIDAIVALNAHVGATLDNTPWISTSASLGVLAIPQNFQNHRIVVIDMDKVTMLPEVSNNREDWYGNEEVYGTRAQEYTFYQSIDKDAVELFLDYNEIEKINTKPEKTDFEQVKDAAKITKTLLPINSTIRFNENAIDKQLMRYAMPSMVFPNDDEKRIFINSYKTNITIISTIMDYACRHYIENGNIEKATSLFMSSVKIQNKMKNIILDNFKSMMTQEELQLMDAYYDILPQYPFEYDYQKIFDNVIEDPTNIINYPKAPISLQYEALRKDIGIAEILQSSDYPQDMSIWCHKYIKEYQESIEASHCVEQHNQSGLWVVKLPHENTNVVTDLLKNKNDNILIFCKQKGNNKERVHAEFIGNQEILLQLKQKFHGIIVDGCWCGHANLSELTDFCNKEIQELKIMYLIDKKLNPTIMEILKKTKLEQHFYPTDTTDIHTKDNDISPNTIR